MNMKNAYQIIFVIFFIFVTAAILSAKNLDALVDYSIQYEPCKNDLNCLGIGLPNPPKEVLDLLESADPSIEYKQAVTLVLLKTYRYHLENFHQGYEIRGEITGILWKREINPFLQAFHDFSGVSISGEFVHSEIGYKWASQNRAIANTPEIMSELKRIELELGKIEKGIYWENQNS